MAILYGMPVWAMVYLAASIATMLLIVWYFGIKR